MASSSNLETLPTTDRPPKLRRRWLLSLKIFLAVNALIFALGAGTVYWRISRFEAAQREIDRWKGTCTTEVKIPDAIPKWAHWRWVEKTYTKFQYLDFGKWDQTNSGFSDDSLRIIAAGPEIVILNLNNTSVTDSGLRYLVKHRELTHLDLSGTKITDTGVKLFENHVQLTGLGLSKTVVTDAALETVGKLPKINWLALDRCSNITDAGIRSIRDLPIKVLFVMSTPITDEGFSVIVVFPQLSHLSFDAGRFRYERFAKLEQTAPISLQISGEIDDEHLRSISELPNLQQLHLTKLTLNEAGARVLLNSPILRSLTCEEVMLAEGAVDRISELKTVRSLSFFETNLSDDDINKLTALAPALNTLILYHTGITDAALVHAQKFTRLSRLGIFHENITDAGVAHLEGMTWLGTLDLKGTNVTDESITVLKSLSSLSLLTVQETRVSEQGSAQLTQALPKLTIYRDP